MGLGTPTAIRGLPRDGPPPREAATPLKHGWTDTTNLLWGLAHQKVSPIDIRVNLPIYYQWPAELRACIEQPERAVYAGLAKMALIRWLVSQLYPTHLDLHAYRVLLVAATGHAPEEVTALDARLTSSTFRQEFD